MAFGSIMMQPGYRSPTRSIAGAGYKPPSKSYRPPPAPGKPMGSGAFGGGVPGFPTRRPPAMPRSSGSISVHPSSPYGRGGAGSNFTMPPPQQFEPATYSDPNIGYMANYAKGLMDPESDYYKRLSAGMQRQIGEQSAAQQRAAALRGAWGGLGGGRGAEVMQTAADIGQAGLEAQGQAEAGLRLAAPQLGMQALAGTFQPQLGYHQLTEGSRQWAGGMGEGARQFGAGVGLQQQQMASQAAAQQAQLQMQQNQMAQQQNQFNQEMQYNYWKAMQDQMAQNYLA